MPLKRLGRSPNTAEVLLPEGNENTSDRGEAKTDAQKLHESSYSLYGVTEAAHQCGANPVELVDVEATEVS